MPLTSLLRAFGSKPAKAERTIRVGVVGAGRMGHFHARHLAKNPRATLVGIADPEAAKVEKVAKELRTAAFSGAQSLIGKVDAVVIASPTSTHHAIGTELLNAGISCLIEKPIATNLEQAEDLIRAAERNKRVLQIGHIERFNPAVLEAAKHIQSPRFIEINRLGPYDPRVADIGVVLDLMIHDLDMVLFLVGSEVTRVEAFGAKVLSNHEDIAKVRLHFANGCIADLSASRVSLKKYRFIRIFQKDSYLSLDYAGPALKIYQKKSTVVKGLGDLRILNPKLAKRDALGLELDHFIDCVLEGKTPMVSGQHGRDALHLAREVLRNLKVDG